MSPRRREHHHHRLAARLLGVAGEDRRHPVETAPIADSEDELREFLADLGARQNRPFTEARPSLHLRLPGGARLAAGSWVIANTSVVIRRHGMREVSMDEMVYDRKACSPVLADFVAACVRAGKSIVVSGVQGSGKTTWVRALCSCIPPWEMIGTFETEFELHLHELVDRHHIVHAWEHRPGSGEVGIDGRRPGSSRSRRPSTTPSGSPWPARSSARSAARRCGTCSRPWSPARARSAPPTPAAPTTPSRSSSPAPWRRAPRSPASSRSASSRPPSTSWCTCAPRSSPSRDGTFRKRRWVEEVLVVDPSADAVRGYATAPVFAPNQLGQAVATGKLDDLLAQELARHGFDLEAYKTEAKAYEGVATT